MTNKPSDKITRIEMNDALLRSGYLLELRVESQLRKHWGSVEANVTFPDKETGKSREFDLLGTTIHSVDRNNSDFLVGALLIECINNPQPLVILTKKPQFGSFFIYRQGIKMSGLPIKIPAEEKDNGWQQLSGFLKMEDYHHYCKGRVGTQFCSFVKKKDKSIHAAEWMATHEGSHYDSFQKLCDVTDHYIEKYFGSWTSGTFATKEFLTIAFFYPVIIIQGDLVEAKETKQGVKFQDADHLQLRRSVTTREGETIYQIDIIKESYLPKYLEMVHTELKKTARLLHLHQEIVHIAIDRIVNEAKKSNSSERIRKIMDYDESA